MPLNRNSLLVTKATFALPVMVAATIVFVATGAGAQSDSQPGDRSENRPDDQAVERSAQEVAIDARQYLRSALTSDKGHIRFEALRGARQLREDWIAEVVVPYCHAPNLTEQVLALELIASTDPELGHPIFVELLDHKQRSVRLRALLGVELTGDPDSAFKVVRVMEDDPDIDVRVVAARTLGSLGNPGATRALRGKITSHHAALREQAVLALLKLEDDEVGDYLIELLDEGRDLDMFDTMRLLALVPDPSLIERISPYLEVDDQLVRAHAAITILSILERSRAGEP